jgi:hypothetical protein
MNDTVTTQVFGIKGDMDRPLYRIFPLWFFEAALRVNGGNLALVRPKVWEDPHEDPCAQIYMSQPNGTQDALSAHLKPAYAQCWSFEGQSDALLRAYSRVTKDAATNRNVEPKYEGVQVRTTPRKLLRALNTFLDKRQNPELRIYLGAVQYVPNVFQAIVNNLDKLGPSAIGDGEYRAQSLLLKRVAFQHEAEVRIILIPSLQENSDLFYVDIDPDEVFDDVRFDPRLALFERYEREKKARELGYQGPFSTDDRYLGTLVDFPVSEAFVAKFLRERA